MNTGGVTVAEAIQAATERFREIGTSGDEERAEARILMMHALQISREALHTQPSSRPLTADESARYESLVARRCRREPLAYITGTREFYGLTFEVSSAVLIPRPETELLAEAALRHLDARPLPQPLPRAAGEGSQRSSEVLSSPLLAGDGRPKPGGRGLGGGGHIADIGTGSGCIAIAVTHSCPFAHAWASDISEEALAVARRNAERNGVAERVTFLQGDMLDPLTAFAPFDVIVCNPPYIAAAEVETLMPEVRDWEPRIALGTREDALYFYRRLAAEAPPLLAPSGLLAVEVGMGQADAVARLWHEAGLTNVQTMSDYAGIERVVTGVKSPGD